MSYRVLITNSARNRIVEQAKYIASESQSLSVAQRWLQQIYDSVDTLIDFPRRCAPAAENDLREYEIRRLVVGRYLIVFTIIDPDLTVIVIGFRHGSQLPRPDDLPDSQPDSET
jgi:plasmid stabilization system protein ParE